MIVSSGLSANLSSIEMSCSYAFANSYERCPRAIAAWNW
jgi:hypothetical protein